MDYPLVSIIIPTYKRPDKLERAIDSVFEQSYENWELIIVDDNDSDSEYRKETEKFMSNYLNNDKVKYLKHLCNKGGSAARNTGIKNAKGEYIAFLDDDDRWFPEKLEKMIKEFSKKDKDYGVCFSNYYLVKTEGIFPELKPRASGDIFKNQLLRDHVSPTSAVIVRKICFEKAGFFDENLPARQDYDLWLRIAKYYKFIYLDEPLMYMYRKDDSISSDYKNCIRGTKIVLGKIKNELDKYDIDYQNKVYSSQYTYLGRVCYAHDQYKMGKKYFYRSLRFDFNIKSLLLLLISLLGPRVWKIGSKVRNKILALIK